MLLLKIVTHLLNRFNPKSKVKQYKFISIIGLLFKDILITNNQEKTSTMELIKICNYPIHLVT